MEQNILLDEHDVIRIGERIGLAGPVNSSAQTVRMFPLDGKRPFDAQIRECRIQDRKLGVGDLVRRFDKGLAGCVTAANISITVTPVYPINPSTLISHKLDAAQCSFIHSFEEGMLVSHGNWVGEITTIKDKIGLLFPSSNAICIPSTTRFIFPDDGIHEDSSFALARLHPGQPVRFNLLNATVDALKDATWLAGEFRRQFVNEQAIVIGVKAISATVDWRVFNSLKNTNLESTIPQPPPEKMKISDLNPLTSQFEDTSFQIGDLVFLKDEATAKQLLSLNDETEKMETHPYLFALKIMATNTTVDVRWQDGVVSENIASTDLYPVLYPDDHDFWPTDYVLLNQSSDINELTNPNVALKDRVGMVISADPRARTVHVRWFDADMNCLESEHPIEYSAYEVQLHATMQHRIGDRVVLTKSSCSDGGDNEDENWFAEILNVQISDGLLRVRFLESGSIAICAPNSVFTYQNRDDDNHDDGDSEDEGGLEVFKKIDNSGENDDAKSGVSWETDSDGFVLEEDEDDSKAMEDIKTFADLETSIEQRLLEWENFKTVDLVPSNHKFISTGHVYSLLSKNLPQGILVRAYDDRIDLIRVLIVGPESTPYEGCLFLFDVSLPPDFPTVPPLVHFHSHTFGMGRINPNLYEDGKVCLSLLGTWSGKSTETWSSKATLLQLVISLQSLVLTRSPYFNEPGFEQQAGSSEGEANSRLYNERVYLIVLACVERWLLLSGFSEDEDCDGFRNEVLYHFLRMEWLRKILERARTIATRSVLAEDDSDAIMEYKPGDFPILCVSVGCLKLLK
ncbi:hypothetical protein HK100_006943, partial [Physocladia obscura]